MVKTLQIIIDRGLVIVHPDRVIKSARATEFVLFTGHKRCFSRFDDPKTLAEYQLYFIMLLTDPNYLFPYYLRHYVELQVQVLNVS